MERLMAFVLLSLPIVILSWRTLFYVGSHGFYRFFSWECILWLLVSNVRYWFHNPFGILQIFSWIFLIFSVYLVTAGVILLKKKGKPGKERDEKGLYQFEKTSDLIDTGIYKYIRHPLYSSLLFLTWGIFLKHTTVLLFLVAMVSTLFLFLTSKSDERECIGFFGDSYREYMSKTRRFIPFIV